MSKSRSKVTYHHGDLRQALVEASLEIIAETRDASSVSLREVARRVGVSPAAPYRHFADKDVLLAAVAEEGFQQLLLALRVEAHVTDEPLARLQANGVAYVKFAIAHPAHYRVMFNSFRVEKENYPSLNTVAREAFAEMVHAITAGQSIGVIQPSDPRQLAWISWSLVHGLALLLIDRQLPIVDEQEISSLVTLATHSLIYGLQKIAK
ncbi:TetR/AcrR family transcriptional regulator [Synechococcus elongatus]|uniref:TetR/AcrR family transcriptional regulator n=1 Tax=Synechococcus elongatus PCC 11802 TaxID=2283154 RepID=A0AAT9JNE7_SYNEL|nr:TetR/AcrR family transcriptional regulator [Synechococcus elongatus]QFZ92464.1 TetR/AcrR family transcriptional regulator [Synechococcus elongatus PCC 11802]